MNSYAHMSKVILPLAKSNSNLYIYLSTAKSEIEILKKHLVNTFQFMAKVEISVVLVVGAAGDQMHSIIDSLFSGLKTNDIASDVSSFKDARNVANSLGLIVTCGYSAFFAFAISLLKDRSIVGE